MNEPLHLADKLVYTAIALYALAIAAGMIFGPMLPYEQAKRVELWTDSLAAIPFAMALFAGITFMLVVPLVLLYMVWFGDTPK